jgi:hypothetical protein
MVQSQVGWDGLLHYELLDVSESLIVEPWHNVVIEDINSEFVSEEPDVSEFLESVGSETVKI